MVDTIGWCWRLGVFFFLREFQHMEFAFDNNFLLSDMKDQDTNQFLI